MRIVLSPTYTVYPHKSHIRIFLPGLITVIASLLSPLIPRVSIPCTHLVEGVGGGGCTSKVLSRAITSAQCSQMMSFVFLQPVLILPVTSCDCGRSGNSSLIIVGTDDAFETSRDISPLIFNHSRFVTVHDPNEKVEINVLFINGYQSKTRVPFRKV